MRTQFYLQDWLKDKSQKIETRDGRIVHNIWPVKEPLIVNGKKAEVCALIEGEEDALVFFEGGKYLTVNSESPFDLFIVTPEEELTELEIHLLDWLSDDTSGEIPMETMKEVVRNRAAEILALARKELENEAPSIIHAQSFNAGLKHGKTEALKDLPRWRECADCTPRPKYSNEWIFSIDSENVTRESAIVHKGYFLPLDGLEKLPGFKED